MQKTLDDYGAGVVIRRSSCRRSIRRPKSSMPSVTSRLRAPIWSGRKRGGDLANRIVPEARGRAAKIIQDAEAYREQKVATPSGQTSRFRGYTSNTRRRPK